MFIHELSLNYTLLKSEDKSHSGVSGSLWPHGPCSPWNSPGQNPGVSSLSLLQGIFPTHGSNPGLLHCRQILYQLSHKGSPRILEWVACPFSRGSSWHRNWTGVSCIAGGFFTNWALREGQSVVSDSDSFQLYSPWHSPGQNTGVGSLSLFQGIFPTQGSLPGDSLPAKPPRKPVDKKQT